MEQLENRLLLAADLVNRELDDSSNQGRYVSTAMASGQSKDDASAPEVKKSADSLYAPDRLIVKLNQDGRDEARQAIQADVGGQTFRMTRSLGIEVWTVPLRMGPIEPGDSRSLVLELINQYKNDPRVEYMEPDYIVSAAVIPNDTQFNDLWGMHNTGQTGGTADADIDAPEAWDRATGSATIIVGVIDSGVDHQHPDLMNNMWVNAGEVAADGVDNDGNGYIDDIYGFDFVNFDGDPMDDNDHGTHVSGTIGAEGNNSQGVVGVNWQSSIMGLKFLGANGSGFISDAVLAQEYATLMGAHLTNNSWGGGGYSQAMVDAITAAAAEEMLFVAAAGNGAYDNDANASYPSGYANDNIIAVAASDHNDNRAGFSQWGATTVDIAAPGANIVSTIPGNQYAPFDGTSMASPAVAGVAALLLAEDPTMTYAQVKGMILANADVLPQWDGLTLSGARLNANQPLANLGKAEISVVAAGSEIISGSSSVNLGSVLIGSSKELTVKVRNQGSEVLSVGNALSSHPDFDIVGYAPDSLETGESVTFQVLYTPTSISATSTTISIGSNDLDESTFIFDIVATPVVPSVAGNAFEDYDADGLFEDNERGLASQIVYLDANLNDTFDIFSQEEAETDPVDIFDNTTSNSPLVVSGYDKPIFDIDVRINIEHTWLSDLVIQLVTPSGDVLDLATNQGGSGVNYVNTVFDDEALFSITEGAAPFTGSFRPHDSLSFVDGMSPNGTWQLRVTDVADLDEGRIVDWAIVFRTSEEFARTDENGFYGFVGLDNGSYSVRSDLPAGWTASLPSGREHNLTLDDFNTSYVDVNYGSGMHNRVYTRVIGDNNSNGMMESTEVGLVGQVLFADSNFNGVRDTGTVSFVNSLDVSIPDPGTVTSMISVPSDAGTISDLEVRVNITHTWNEDLDVFLIAPDGTRVELFSDVGLDGDNFIDTILDDQASQDIIGGVAPFTGTYRPEGSLAVLNGKAAGGNWTLEITDDFGQDMGVLNEWEIIIHGGEAQLLTNEHGNALFDVSNGLNAIRLIQPLGLTYTLPPDGLHTMVVSDEAMFDRIFGLFDEVPGPTDILLSNDAIYENMGDGAVIGALATVDPLFGNTYTYTLVSGSGSTDNAAFTIVGSTLMAVNNFNFEVDSSYSIRIRSETQVGEWVEKPFTITVLDENEAPSIDILPDLIYPEDTPEFVVPLTGISGGGGEMQPIRVSVMSSNPSAVANPFLAYTSPNAAGSLTFTPEPNRNGATIISVRVEDAGPDRDFETTDDNRTTIRDFDLLIQPDPFVEVDGTYGDDEIVATFVGGAAWNVSINGNSVYTGDVPVGMRLYVDGGFGNDTLRVIGSASADNIIVNGSSFTVNNSDGESINVEQVRFDGGNGNDVIQVASGNATITGGSGSDRIVGPNAETNWTVSALNAGSLSYGFESTSFTSIESVTGGTANDSLVVTSAGRLSGSYNGGTGTNTLSFASWTAPVSVNLTAGSSTAFTAGVSNLSNVFGGNGADTLTGNGSDNLLVGNGGADTLNGSGGSDDLRGGMGDDTYLFPVASSSEADRVTEFPSEGNDSISFAGITANVNFNLGNTDVQSVHLNRTVQLNDGATFENVTGGTGHDTLTGNALNNILNGSGGNDTITGGLGDDTMAGGTGDDSYVFGAPGWISELDSLSELSSQGNDTLNFSTITANITISLALTTIQEVHADRRIVLNSGSAFENVYGGTGNDSLTGNNGNNVLQGNGGNDSLNGAQGNDSLVGGTGDDTYVFGATAAGGDADSVTELPMQGNDTLSFSTQTGDVSVNLGVTTAQAVHANRTLLLSSGTVLENVTSGSGNDTLIGNGLANRLVSGSGDDTINGMQGSDTMIGGVGNDVYIFGATAVSGDADVVTELTGEGTDTLNFGSVVLGVTLNLGSILAQPVHTGRTLRLSSGSVIENATTGSGSDLVTGNTLNNVLTGNGGNDILVGLNGDDTLQGDADRDIMIGGNGVDSIVGGDGDDLLIGGRTTYDGNATSLNTIRTAWTGAGTYASRVAILRSGVGTPAVSLIAGTSVLNDGGADDVMAGGVGSDWFFRAVDDAIADLAAGEFEDLL